MSAIAKLSMANPDLSALVLLDAPDLIRAVRVARELEIDARRDLREIQRELAEVRRELGRALEA